MLQGRRALVVGVANARSIAWGIADRWRQEGAEVFVTYQVIAIDVFASAIPNGNKQRLTLAHMKLRCAGRCR